MLVVAEPGVSEVVVDGGPLLAGQGQEGSRDEAACTDGELEYAWSAELTPEVGKAHQAEREVGEEVLGQRPSAAHGLCPVHVLVESLSLDVDR